MMPNISRNIAMSPEPVQRVSWLRWWPDGCRLTCEDDRIAQSCDLAKSQLTRHPHTDRSHNGHTPHSTIQIASWSRLHYLIPAQIAWSYRQINCLHSNKARQVSRCYGHMPLAWPCRAPSARLQAVPLPPPQKPLEADPVVPLAAGLGGVGACGAAAPP